MSGRAESADARTAAGSGAGARTCAGHIARSSVRQQIVAVCGELCVASCVWRAVCGKLAQPCVRTRCARLQGQANVPSGRGPRGPGPGRVPGARAGLKLAGVGRLESSSPL